MECAEDHWGQNGFTRTVDLSVLSPLVSSCFFIRQQPPVYLFRGVQAEKNPFNLSCQYDSTNKSCDLKLSYVAYKNNGLVGCVEGSISGFCYQEKE